MRGYALYALAWLVGYREVPYGARSIFRRELIHMAFWGLVWGGLNGGFCSYIARRSLHASDTLVSLIISAMAFANLFALWWAWQGQHFNKKRILSIALVGLSLVLCSFVVTPTADSWFQVRWPGWFVSLTSPTSPLVALLFSSQVILAWFLVQGINTIRTSIWKNNYPDSHRGRILARFAIWQVLIGSCWVWWVAAYLDGYVDINLSAIGIQTRLDLSWIPGAGDHSSYRYAMPMMALPAILALLVYLRIPLRRSREIGATSSVGSEMESGETGSYATPGWFSLRRNVLFSGLRSSWIILKEDRWYRAYMGWMFLSGSCVMLVFAPFVLILSDVFEVDYVRAAMLLTFAPQVVMVLSTPVWARLFDRWDLFYFRYIQIGLWGVSRIILAVGVWQTAMWIVVASVVVQGIALGGGRFAWQLGHMSFSNRENDSMYLVSAHQYHMNAR